MNPLLALETRVRDEGREGTRRQRQVPDGQSPVPRQWQNPVRPAGSLSSHQRVSPELTRRLTPTASWINS